MGRGQEPGPQDFRPDLTPRDVPGRRRRSGGRAKLKTATVTFRNGRNYAMAAAPPLDAGAVDHGTEVAVKSVDRIRHQASLVASLITA